MKLSKAVFVVVSLESRERFDFGKALIAWVLITGAEIFPHRLLVANFSRASRFSLICSSSSVQFSSFFNFDPCALSWISLNKPSYVVRFPLPATDNTSFCDASSLSLILAPNSESFRTVATRQTVSGILDIMYFDLYCCPNSSKSRPCLAWSFPPHHVELFLLLKIRVKN